MYAKHSAKANTTHLESRLEVIQGHASWDHWKADEGLHVTYNNAGFRVGNFEGKVWASPFSRTPLSFGAPWLGNPANIRQKLYISRN